MKLDANNPTSYFIDRHLDEGRGDRIAVIDPAGAHSYAALAGAVNRAGNLLRVRGLSRHDRLLIVLEDGLEFVATFFGALKIGAVPIPLNTLLMTDDYRYLVRDAAPRAVAMSQSARDRVGPAIAGLIDPSRILVADGVGDRERSLTTALAECSDRLDPVAVADEEVGFWLYSSGSTGGPKGVLHRSRALRETARLYGRGILGIRPDDVIYSASKCFFAYGLGNSCTFPLDAGATTVLRPERPTPAAVFAILRDYRVTTFFGFPTLYAAMLAAADELAPGRFPNLRRCVSAGEALPAAVAERWADRFGIEILDGLGSTEALHIFISNRPGHDRRGTSGQPVAGYEVELRGDNGERVTSGEIGDLWCRGPSIATGYWNNPAATQRTFVDGWMRTGDKYVCDADGFYHYCGRSDDMLKVAGVWVSPNEVESALIAHPQVLEVAVVGHANADGLIKPRAFVVLKDPAAASPELARQLQQFVKDRIAPYKYPHWVEFRTDLPKTATGKIRRALLRVDPAR